MWKQIYGAHFSIEEKMFTDIGLQWRYYFLNAYSDWLHTHIGLG